MDKDLKGYEPKIRKMNQRNVITCLADKLIL
jgi:hypothetical protein